MSKTSRVLALVVLLLTVVVLNVAATADEVAMEAESSSLPCYDMYQGCMSGGGHSADYCDGVWCGCMRAKYGTTNC